VSRSSSCPNQRWHIAPAQPEQAIQLAHVTQLSPLLAQVLINRGFDTPDAAQVFLDPERQQLPSPLEEFPDLPIALEFLLRAIASRQPIAICGDYDADGMTSTALLLRALRAMGAVVDYAIPSRMQEGYGINRRIVEEFYQEGVGLILTVDNGIAAYEPIARARELGLTVIITDHHDIPEVLPPANAILNPKLIDPESPYCGIAGVGVAYVLAVCLAQCLQKTQDLTTPLLELFTLGTIADLAPLTGVNRRWVRRGLKLLPQSRIVGIQALIQVAGLSQEKQLKPEAIGFRLGPRINAIGRISDPQIVIELLTTEDEGLALERAMQCEQVNQLRQRLCELIEQEAIAYCEQSQMDWQSDRVLVVVQPDWHHGVIGIVASRLVERYGVPVFIGTYEEGNPDRIRGSARSIPEFHVFEALQFCGEILDRYGGHRAAGGFSLEAKYLEEFRSRLSLFANGQLQPEHLKPLVTIDVQSNLSDLSFDLYHQIDALHPCGIENPDPIFWTPNVRILEQKAIGRTQDHLKLTLTQPENSALPMEANRNSPLPPLPAPSIKAIAWRWGEYCPLPSPVDIAYRLRLNEWNGTQSVELELVGVRPAAGQTTIGFQGIQDRENGRSKIPVRYPESVQSIRNETKPRRNHSSAQGINLHDESHSDSNPLPGLANEGAESPDDFNCASSPSYLEDSQLEDHQLEDSQQNHRPSLEEELRESRFLQTSTPIEFYYNKRKYTCGISQVNDTKELRIRNFAGQVLAIQPQQRRGLLGKCRAEAKEIDISEPYYFNLIRSALSALELSEKNQLLEQKKKLLTEKDQHILTLHDQITHLNQELNQTQEQEEQLRSLQTELQQRQATLHEYESQITQLQVQIETEKSLAKESSAPKSVRQSVPEKTDPNDPKQQARKQFGSNRWLKLNPHSQRDLVTAFKHQIAIQNEPISDRSDYSEAGLRLGFVVEREVIQPFFKHLHQYLLNHGGTDEIGGVTLRARKKYTLGMLPPLLTVQWYSFREVVLKGDRPEPDEERYCSIQFDTVNQKDRTTVQNFLDQWQHPIAEWIVQQPVGAASAIDQINKLRNIAAHADSPLRDWQYDLLQALVMGSDSQRGIFQEIYQD
jgi:single-stranded-DNA-specific exonuclease